MPTLSEKELLKIKEDIESAKTRVSELRGKRELLMQELKDKFDVKSTDAAAKKLLVIKNELEAIETKIQAAIKRIKSSSGFL